jgi:hypothetical protein
MFDSLPSDLPDVMLQLIVRDSEGRLITYVQADQIIGIDPTVLDQYLDDRQNKKIITLDGKSHELVQWQGRTETIDKTHAMTVFTLYGLVDDTYQIALEILHNSYQVNPGDTVTVYWNVLRPL